MPEKLGNREKCDWSAYPHVTANSAHRISLAPVQSTDCTLKAPDPAPLLGRKTNILAENRCRRRSLMPRSRAVSRTLSDRSKPALSQHGLAVPAPKLARTAPGPESAMQLSGRRPSRSRSRSIATGRQGIEIVHRRGPHVRAKGPRPPGERPPQPAFISQVAIVRRCPRPTSKAGGTRYITLWAAIGQMSAANEITNWILPPGKPAPAGAAHAEHRHTIASPRTPAQMVGRGGGVRDRCP